MAKTQFQHSRCLSGILITSFISTIGFAGGFSPKEQEEIQNQLNEFKFNPVGFMAKPPTKVSGTDQSKLNNAPVPSLNRDFSSYKWINSEIDRLAGMQAKNINSDLRSASSADFNNASGVSIDAIINPDGTDSPASLVDSLSYQTLRDMENANLMQSALDTHPWSSTYWPVSQGVIAWRYADPYYPRSSDWNTNVNYVLTHLNACSLDQLSPAEKYDLLVGDPNQSLTHEMLNEGATFFRSFGTVASWMGICHGWSPASYMDARPAHSITVTAADGVTKIPFRPSDIKALSSALWAKGNFQSRFIGKRCNQENPQTDGMGRIIDPNCYGENPAAWHLSVVNQIGVGRRSFIIDAHHDTQIWNQPVFGYKYSYFNPETKYIAPNLEGATVPLQNYTTDQFRSYRASGAAYVVGVAMDLTYVSETAPSLSSTDSPEQDALVTVRYLYDLELDANQQIIGGEWYSNAHPGFMWTPVKGAKAFSVGDGMLGQSGSQMQWDGSGPIPSTWFQAIQQSSAQGQPLERVVSTLEVMAAM